MYTILYWVIFGLLAGGVASFIAPNFKGGIIGSIALGIIGAVVGGYLGQMFFGTSVTGFNLPSFALAVVGSLLILFIAGLFTRRQG